MISEWLLHRLLLAAAALVFVALAWILLHALWLRRRDLRRARLHSRALQMLRIHLSRASDQLDAKALRELARRSTSSLIDVFVRVSAAVQAADLRRLRAYAEELGLTRRSTRLVRSGSWVARLHASRLLTLLGIPATADAALLFRNARPELRAQAADWIAVAPTPELIDLLLSFLGDPERLAHHAVHDALVRSRGVTVERLAMWFGADHETAAVREALQVAARISAHEFLEPALRYSAHADPRIRGAGAEVLGAIGGEEASARLTKLLGDPSADVRVRAVTSLGVLRAGPAAAAIGELLRDEDFGVRRAAALALRRFDAVGALILRSYAADSFKPAAEIAQHVLDLPFTGSAV